MASQKKLTRRLNRLDGNYLTGAIEEYKHYTRLVKFENAKETQKVVEQIVSVCKEKKEDEIKQLCETYDLALLNPLYENQLRFVSKKTYTTYLYENNIVTVKMFNGDSWVRTIESAMNTQGKPLPDEIIQFHMNLEYDYLSNKNPLRKRVASYSMDQLEKKSNLSIFISDEFTYYHMDDFLHIYKDGKVQKVVDFKSPKNRLQKLFRSYLNFGAFFVVASLLIMVGYFSSFLRIDINAPELEFSEYIHEVGDKVLVENLVVDVDDNFDYVTEADVRIVSQRRLEDPGTAEITFEIEDKTGNLRQYINEYDVVDTTKPSIYFKEDLVEIPISEIDRFDYMSVVARMDDNHEIRGYSYDDSLVNTETLGYYDVYYRVEDMSGNVKIENQRINIIDITRPIIHFNDLDKTIAYDDLTIELLEGFLEEVSDNYELAEYGIVFDTIPYNKIGEQKVTFYAVDTSGNRRESKLTINITDEVAPVVLLPHTVEINVDDIYTFEDEILYVQIYDNHRIVNVDLPLRESLTGLIGIQPYTVTVIDEAGNETTMSGLIDLVDTVSPVLTLKETDLYFNHMPGILELRENVDILEDNFDQTLNIWTEEPFDLIHYPGVYVYRLNVRDQSGNQASQEVTVHIYDDEAPVVQFTVDSIWVNPLDPGSSPYTYAYMLTNHAELVDKITDNFDQLLDTEYVFSTAPYALDTVGVYDLEYRTIDAFGNAGLSVLKIYVYEEEAPEIELTSSVITVNQGEEVDFLDYILRITDNYEGVIPIDRATVISYGGYDKDTPGEYFIRLSVFDVFNNEDRATLKVTVVS